MALLQQDLVPASGDSLITFDTDTNLEWLSLTKTVNLSISDVRNGTGGYATTYGFRYANGAELQALWNHAGITRFAPTSLYHCPIATPREYKSSSTGWAARRVIRQPARSRRKESSWFHQHPATRGGTTLVLHQQPWWVVRNHGYFPNVPQGVTPEDYRSSALASYLVRNPVSPAPPRNLRVGEK